MRIHLITIAILGLIVACGPSDKKSELESLKKEYGSMGEKIAKLEKELAMSDTTAGALKAKQIVATEVQLGTYRHYLEVQGKVDAESNVDLSSQTGGLLLKVFVQEGSRVSKGQLLAETDNLVLKQQVDEAQSSYQLAKTLFDRQKNLWDQKIGSEVQFLTARTNKQSAEKRVAAMTQQLEMSRIKSPINGTVDRVYVKEGNTLIPGRPAFRVVNFSNLKIIASVPETYASKLSVKDSVELYFPDTKKTVYSRVSFVARVIDPINRTFDVEVSLPASVGALNPNMVSLVKIIDMQVDSAIVVPINAIQKSNQESYVFIVEQEGNNQVARKRNVLVGSTYNGNALITEGLKAGDKLITVGHQSLTNNMPVKL